MLTRAEAILTSAVAAIAIAILTAYAPYRVGWRVSPALVLVLTIAGAAIVIARLYSRASLDREVAVALSIVVSGIFAALLWMARPALLPLGGGPDLAHHLVLVNYIERHWQLVESPALVPYLGDMIYYTPGSHLLFALAGQWTRSDGLHLVHTILALTVALKCGLILCLARRLMPSTPHRVAFAVAAVAMLFLPFEYVVGSFARHSFWAQVVAELFACAAWWTIVVWQEQPRRGMMALFALFGAATFVTWPIWIGPIVIVSIVVLLSQSALAPRTRLAHLTIALVPVTIAAAMHSVGRLSWLRIAATSGYAIRPSAAISGWTFLVLSAAGLVLLARQRSGRSAVVLIGATLVQTLTLFAVAHSQGADTPYLALKMMYLLPYPLAIAAGRALAEIWAVGFAPTRLNRYAWIAVALVAAATARRAWALPRPAPIVTESAYQAGRWARDHVDPACVDYLAADGYTGYWLHLAVLDNPRNTARMADPDTFDPHEALARWIATDGLPFAIVDDVHGFSGPLFSSTDTLASFPPAAVIRRHGKAICP